MSGSVPQNNQAVQFEQQQAAQAAQKEADRQARLSQGQTMIDQIFNGQPVMGTKTSNFDWSTFTPSSGRVAASGVPAGYTAVQIPRGTNATASGVPGAPGATTRSAATSGITALNSNNTPIYGAGGGGAAGSSATPMGSQSRSRMS